MNPHQLAALLGIDPGNSVVLSTCRTISDNINKGRAMTDDIDRIPFKSVQPPPAPHRIVKAAVHYRGTVYTGWRHSDIIMHIHHTHGAYTTQEDQGFVDLHGNFYNRYQSARIALRARQITKLPSVIMSEDLWDKHGKARTPGEPYEPST